MAHQAGGLELVRFAGRRAVDSRTLRDEVGDDALGRPLGDSHSVGDVAHPDPGVTGQAQQDRRVVRHEGPDPLGEDVLNITTKESYVPQS